MTGSRRHLIAELGLVDVERAPSFLSQLQPTVATTPNSTAFAKVPGAAQLARSP